MKQKNEVTFCVAENLVVIRQNIKKKGGRACMTIEVMHA
jgi:hypothetical protein